MSGQPDAAGHFGPYGGRFVPEALIAALDELAEAHRTSQQDPAFVAELDRLLSTYAGRPTPLTDARRLSVTPGSVHRPEAICRSRQRSTLSALNLMQPTFRPTRHNSA